MVHVVVAIVVHDRVREHQHHVALELRRRPHLAALNVLLDRVQVHRSERGGGTWSVSPKGGTWSIGSERGTWSIAPLSMCLLIV